MTTRPISFLVRGDRRLSKTDFWSEITLAGGAPYHQFAPIAAHQSCNPRTRGLIGEEIMQTLSHSNAVPINPGRNIATIAVVGIAHIALIYAVLVALDFVPVPSFVPPTVIRVLDHTRQPPPPPMDAPTPTFLHPQGPVVVEPPIPLDPLTPPADSH